MKKKVLTKVCCLFGCSLLLTIFAAGDTVYAAQETVPVKSIPGLSGRDLEAWAQAGKQQPETWGSEEEGPQGPQTPEISELEGVPMKIKLKKPVLKAASKPDGVIKISWKKVKNAAEYTLYRSTSKEGGFQQIYHTKTGSGSFLDKNRDIGKPYYYKMTIYSKGRTAKADSKAVKGCPLGKAELTGISNLDGSQKLVLHWKPVKGADSYQVLRKDGSGNYQAIASVSGKKTTYTDSGRNGGTAYTYKVYAKDAKEGRGSHSSPKSQMAIDKNKKMIALTYDDGPSAHTPTVLKALKKYGVHATFFVVGSSVGRYPDSIRQEAIQGCEIGNHTYSHNNLSRLGAAQVQQALARTNEAVQRYTGTKVRLMRPPYGSFSKANSVAVGMPAIFWSIDTMDWKTRSTSATIACVKREAYDGAIVLMHDLHQPTAAAADAVVKYLKDAGYQMVTVSEMAAYRGGLVNGKSYYNFRR